jgi:hypothetical protein
MNALRSSDWLPSFAHGIVPREGAVVLGAAALKARPARFVHACSTDGYEPDRSAFDECAENRRLELWRFELDMPGRGYRFSTSGDFRGVTRVFRSVLDS